MSRREKCRPILAAEVARWSATPWQQIVAQLPEEQNYEVHAGPDTYQVAVNLLEDTDAYVHVVVSVDDCSFWLSCCPLSKSFLVEKTTPQPPR